MTGDETPECPECGSDDVEYAGDVATNTHPTAVDPGYAAVYQCQDCGHKLRWTPY